MEADCATPIFTSLVNSLLSLRVPVTPINTSSPTVNPERPVTGPEIITSTALPVDAAEFAKPIKVSLEVLIVETVPSLFKTRASLLAIAPDAVKESFKERLGPDVAVPIPLSKSVEIKFRGTTLSSSPIEEFAGRTNPPAVPCESPALPIKTVLFAKWPSLKGLAAVPIVEFNPTGIIELTYKVSQGLVLLPKLFTALVFELRGETSPVTFCK